MKKVFCLCVFFVFICQSSFAGGIAYNFYVKDVRIDADGKGIVTFVEYLTSMASCASSTSAGSLAFDTNTPGGKAIFSMVVVAKIKDSRIYAKGTGTCTIYSNVLENWSWGKIID